MPGGTDLAWAYGCYVDDDYAVTVIRQISVWHGKDGYILRVAQVPAWAAALDSADEWLIAWWCKITGGWGCPLCLCAKTDWTWRIGWRRDDDGLLVHSLGGWLFRLGQRGGRFRLSRECRVYERPLSFDEVCEFFPDRRTEWDDDGETCVRGVLLT